MRRLNGLSLGTHLQLWTISNFNIRRYIRVKRGAYIDPSIWEQLAIGALRVAPINPAVSGCERLAPATSAIEL